MTPWHAPTSVLLSFLALLIPLSASAEAPTPAAQSPWSTPGGAFPVGAWAAPAVPAAPPAPTGREPSRDDRSSAPPIADYPGPSSRWTAPAPPHELTLFPLASRSNLLPFVGFHVPGVVSVDGGLRIQGGTARETQLELDGMRVHRLLLPHVAVQSLDVYTAGYGTDLADVTGGLVALRTLPADGSLRAKLDLSMEQGPQAGHGLRRLEGAVGVPLGRRFSLLTAVQTSRSALPSDPDIEGIFPGVGDSVVRRDSALVKLGWQPSERHRLQLLAAAANIADDPNVFNREPAAQIHYGERWYLTSARWTGRLGRRWRAGTQVGFERNHDQERPQRCEQIADCDVPAIIQRFPRTIFIANHPMIRHQYRSTVEASAGLEVEQLAPASWLTASLHLTPRVRGETVKRIEQVPGGRYDEYQFGVPFQRTTFFANDPRLEPERFGAAVSRASSQALMVPLEARLSLPRGLHISPGVALVAGQAESTSDHRLADVLLAHVVRAAWQPIGSRDLWLRASTARRADLDLQGPIEQTRPDMVARRCRYDQATGLYDRECEYLGGQRGTVGLACGPNGLLPDGSPCTESTQAPASWEHTVGVDGAIAGGLRAAGQVVDRRTTRGWATRETNRIWNNPGTAVLAYRSGRAETIQDLSSTASSRRRHRAYLAGLSHIAAGAEVHATYSHLATDDGPGWLGCGWGINCAPFQVRDRRHFLHLRGLLDIGHATFSLLYRYGQGRLYQRAYRNEITNSYENRRASTGVNPGNNINDPADDRELRLPNEKELHAQLRLRGRKLTGIDADLYLDALEIISPDPRTVTGDLMFGPLYETETWLRIGLEARF